MNNIITSNIQLKNILSDKVKIAIENVAKIMTTELKSYIREDFYRQYSPILYSRTYDFLNSPSFNLLSTNSAEIFVNTDIMTYIGASGEDVAWLASRGYHGTTDIFRPGYFWDDFLEWANKNVDKLMKIELQNQGLEII